MCTCPPSTSSTAAGHTSFLGWAAEIDPQTGELISRALDARRHPQRAYRTCLGVLGLAKRYSTGA
ncbi:MAG: hypothetical protein PVF74_00220 [Anaerolineales bacterium]